MTVPTSTAKSGPYAGAGTTGPFTVGFRFLENSHLQVIKTSTLGVDSTLTLTSDYTVIGAGGASGAITLVTALAVGEKLTVLRNVPFTQQADYVQNDAFPAESHERALDLLTMQTQQLSEAVSRAATVPASTNDAAGLADAITELASNSASVVAVAGSLPDVELVADNIADVNTVADNIADVTNFADVYQGPKSSDPALRNNGTALLDGDLYFNTTTDVMRVYGGGGWIDAGAALPITINEQALNGTGSQTVFTLSSAPAYTAALEVFVGGVRQSTTTVYSVSGTTLTFTAAPPSGTGNIFCRWVSPISAGVPADGSVSTAKIVDGAVTTAKFVDGAVTAAKLANGGAELGGFRNRIINANPIINQRAYVSGTATTTANQYTLDRWRVVVSGQNVSWTDSGLTRTVTCPAGGFEQVIESLNIEGGTFVLNWTGTATATVNGTAVAKGGTFTLPANTNATVRFSSGTLSNPQIEAGTTATPFERRDHGRELILCQRYFQKIGGTGGEIYAAGYITSSGFIVFPIAFPTMRASPTGTVFGTWAVSNVAQPTLSATSPSAVSVLASGLAVGQGQFASVNATTFISLASEL